MLLWSPFILAGQEVVVLYPDYPDFKQARKGFVKYYQQHQSQVIFTDILFNRKRAGDIKKQVTAIKPDIVFTIGNGATLFALEHLADFPMVFAMVYCLYPTQLEQKMNKHQKGVAGVTINIKPGVMLKRVISLLPHQTTITSIYSDKSSLPAAQLEQQARSFQVNTHLYPVLESNVLDKVLEKIKANTLFWILPDPFIYNSSNLPKILFRLNQKEVLVLAPTRSFLIRKPHAHIAVSVDPEKNGRQAARLAIRMKKEKIEFHNKVQSPTDILIYVKRGVKINPNHTTVVHWVE